MKKFLAILLALSMVLALFACAKTETPAAEEPAVEEATEAPARKRPKPPPRKPPLWP
jgi:predicted lipoprotein